MQRSTKLMFLASAVGWPAVGTDFDAIPMPLQFGWVLIMVVLAIAAGVCWYHEPRT